MDGFRNEMAKLTAEHFPGALIKCRVELFSPALLCEYESPIHTTTPIQSKL